MTTTTVQELVDAITAADAAGAVEDAKALSEELARIQADQARQMPTERQLITPMQGGGFEKVPLEAAPSSLPEKDNTLDGFISNNFARDFMLLAAGAVNARSLTYNDGQQEVKASTPRQVFDAAIANNLLSPTFEPDSKFGAFKKHWDEYKAEKEPSLLGAAARGAVSAIGSTIGATLAGAAASPLGLGAIPVAVAGGAAGGLAQEAISPQTTSDIAQRMFDEAQISTKVARLTGELAPSLATLRPNFIGPNNAFAAIKSGRMPTQFLDFTGSTLGQFEVPAVKQMVAGAGIGGAIPVAIDMYRGQPIDPVRVVQGIAAGGFMEPNSFGRALHDRLATTTKNALEIRNKIFQEQVGDPNITSAIFALQKAGEVNKNGVRLMSGELVGDMLAKFQRVLVARNPGELGNVAMQNERRIAENLALKMQETGGAQREVTEFATNWSNTAMAEADALFAQLSAAGQTDYASTIEAAMRQSASAYAAQRANIINAETADALAARNLEAAVESIKLKMGTREPAAKAIRQVLLSESEPELAAASALYELPKNSNVTTDFSNTYKAVRGALGTNGFGRFGMAEKNRATKAIQFLRKYTRPRTDDEGKQLQVRKVGVLLSDMRVLNDVISEAAESGQTNTVRILKGVYDGMNKDLEAAGDAFPQIKEANAAWREAMRKYGNGVIGRVLSMREAVPTEKTLDAIFAGNSGTQDLSSAQQLRDAIKERPEAIAAVNDWFVNKLAENGGKTYESMRNWMRENQQSEILNVFPEARSTLEGYVRDVRDAELAASAASQAVKTAKDVPAVATVEPDGSIRYKIPQHVKEAATERRDMIKAQALEIKKRLIDETKNNAFSKFVNTSPQNAVSEVLASKDPIAAMQQVVGMAQQDPSGGAMDGLKNALREFVMLAIEKNGRPITINNQPDAPPGRGDLGLSLAKLEGFTKKASTSLRPILEIVYGPDSPEMQALDLARTQMAIWSRSEQTKGSSPTYDLTEMNIGLNELIQDNVLGFISKVGRGFTPTRGVFNKLAWIGDLYTKAYYKGLTEMVERFQVEAMINPELAIEALLPLTPENLPRANALLKTYFVSKDHMLRDTPPLPFSVLNTKQEQLGEGMFLRDKVTGYSIQAKGGKFKTFSDTNKLLGVFDTLQRAKDKAVEENLKQLPELKKRK